MRTWKVLSLLCGFTIKVYGATAISNGNDKTDAHTAVVGYPAELSPGPPNALRVLLLEPAGGNAQTAAGEGNMVDVGGGSGSGSGDDGNFRRSRMVAKANKIAHEVAADIRVIFAHGTAISYYSYRWLSCVC